MSIERARANCMVCYVLASKNPGQVFKEERVSLLGYKQRDLAMQALEVVVVGSNAEDSLASFDALVVCDGCDYSSPKIVEMTEERMVDKRKMVEEKNGRN